MRIVAGLAGGRPLKAPAGTKTRPTADRVREALFSAVEAELGGLDGARVLDLYAGTGALGLEALSRGAAAATFVERDPAVLAVLRANIAAVKLPGAQVVPGPVLAFLDRDPEPFDLVLADPPYAEDAGPLLAALARGWVGGLLVVERATRDDDLEWPAPLRFWRSRKYGDSTLWYGR
jgi:16S rRNA (guanine966-N2)-methyltransferase